MWEYITFFYFPQLSASFVTLKSPPRLRKQSSRDLPIFKIVILRRIENPT